MPVLPAWAITLFWKFVVPLIVSALEKAGAINKAEALAAKAVITLENIKTYPQYPGTDGAPPTAVSPPNENINK